MSPTRRPSDLSTHRKSNRPLYLLGYIPQHGRVYLADKDVNVYSYNLSLSLVEYQTAVLRGDMDAANEILPSIPKEQRTKVATFLEGRGMRLLSFTAFHAHFIT